MLSPPKEVFTLNIYTHTYIHMQPSYAYENPTRALNTTSLKWCLPSIEAIDSGKNSRMLMKVASLKSTRFLQKIIMSDTSLTEFYIPTLFMRIYWKWLLQAVLHLNDSTIIINKCWFCSSYTYAMRIVGQERCTSTEMPWLIKDMMRQKLFNIIV